METSFSSWKVRALAAVGALGVLVLLGWLRGDDDKHDDDDDQAQQAHRQRGTQQTNPNDAKWERLLMQADEFRRRGDVDSAVLCFSQALRLIELDPSRGPNHIYHGVISLTIGELLQQSAKLREALPHIQHARAVLESVDADDVEPEAQALLQQLPYVMSVEAGLLVELDELEAADEALERTVSLHQLHSNVLEHARQQQQQQAQHGMSDEHAIKLSQQRLHINQSIAKLTDLLAKLRIKQRRIDEADVLQQRAIMLMLDAFGINNEATTDALHRLAALRAQRDGVTAIETFESLVSQQRASLLEPCAADALNALRRRLAQLVSFVADQRLRSVAGADSADYSQSVLLYEEARRLLESLPSGELGAVRAHAVDAAAESSSSSVESLDVMAELLVQSVLMRLVVANAELDRPDQSAEALDALRQRVRRVFAVRSWQPPYAESALVRTVSQMVKFEATTDDQGAKRFAPLFHVELALLAQRKPAGHQPLPTDRIDSSPPLLQPGSVLEASFEDPEASDADQRRILRDFTVEPDTKTIVLTSAALSGVRRGHYHVKVTAFSDATKTERLGEHHVLIPSWIDPTGVTDAQELYMKLYAAANNMPPLQT